MNVILYCRVSSDEQSENTSLDYQEMTLRAYCNNRNYNIIDCKREDYSAKHYEMKRPELKSIYNYCKRHKKEVDAILFLRWDRFSRNAEFAFKYKRVFTDEMEIALISIENPIDFSSPDWSTLLGVYCGNAQAENSKISLRTRAGIRETLLKGRCANKAPRGYKNVRTDKHHTHIEIDEKQAPLIEAIFREVAKGIESPSYIRKKMAKHIPESSYFDMLRNIFYAGKIAVPPTKDEPAKIVEGKHEALIDEETFFMVQEVLSGKKKKSPKVNRTTNPDLFLRKFLTCPVCGYSITGATSSGNGGKYTYYNCSHNASHLRTKAKETNEAFAKYLACLKPNETVLELYQEVLKDLQQDTKKERKHEADKLSEELNKVAEKMAKLEDKFIEGDIEKSEYNRIMDRYRKVALDLEKQIDILKTPSRSKIEPKLDYSINLINNIDNYIRNAPVEVKIKLIGSMFPEKIEFDGTDYRTNSYNKVLDLIYQQTNELRREINKNGESFSTFSVSVPRPGVEPGWK